MKTKKLIALALIFCMVLPVLASCKKEPTPADIWNKAAENLANTTDISLNAVACLGKYGISIDYAGNRTTGTKSYDININDVIYPVYSDGSKNYYTADDVKFSVKSAQDSDIMREFMSFSLTNPQRLALENNMMTEVVFEVTETSKKLTFKVDGSTFKNLIAPDENVTFTETLIVAEMDAEYNLKKLAFNTNANGTEFYGFPLIGADKAPQDLFISITNIDFSGTKTPKAPENTSDYPELIALAKTYPTGLFSSLKDSTKIESDINMEIDLVLTKMNISNVQTITTNYINDVKYSRTISKTTTEVLGEKQTTIEDEYYNGKDGYTYYTDSEGANYKLKLEEDTTQSDDILSIFTKDSNLEDVFKNATAAGSTITVEISGEVLQKLMSDTSNSDLGVDIGDTEAKFKDTTLIIKLKNGLVDTVTMDLEVEAEGDLMGTGTTTSITVKGTISVKYFTIMEDYVAEAPTGYENYEDWT